MVLHAGLCSASNLAQTGKRASRHAININAQACTRRAIHLHMCMQCEHSPTHCWPGRCPYTTKPENDYESDADFESEAAGRTSSAACGESLYVSTRGSGVCRILFVGAILLSLDPTRQLRRANELSTESRVHPRAHIGSPAFNLKLMDCL